MTPCRKLLCIADEVDLLVYSPSIKERFGDIDLVLSAGDLPDEYLGYVVSMLNRPIVSVAGNHDSPDAPKGGGWGFPGTEGSGMPGRKEPSGLGRISFRIKKEAGLRILGLPGSIRYNSGPNQYTEAAMTLKVLPLLPGLAIRRLVLGRGVDIILAHSPPKGIHDGDDPAHKGFGIFRWLVGFARPEFFIHGHVHLYDARELRERRFGATTIVNVYGHRILESGRGDTP